MRLLVRGPDLNVGNRRIGTGGVLLVAIPFERGNYFIGSGSFQLLPHMLREGHWSSR